MRTSLTKVLLACLFSVTMSAFVGAEGTPTASQPPSEGGSQKKTTREKTKAASAEATPQTTTAPSEPSLPKSDGDKAPALRDAAPVGLQPDLNVLNYKISGFEIQYAVGGEMEGKKLPQVDELLSVSVPLRREKGVYKEGDSDPLVLKNLAKNEVFTASAIQAINRALVQKLGAKGASGVFVVPDPKQVNPQTGADLRSKGSGKMKLLVYVGVVKQVRTVAKGPAYEPENPVDTKRYERISKNSPTKAGELLEKLVLQEYLSRINRYPGRRVDASVSASGEPGSMYLDYLVREDKRWFTYVQTSNTGTRESGEWRSRVGATVRQLTRLDDILSAEYSTSDFGKSNSGNLSYEIAPLFPDILTARFYGSYADFTADQVGFNNDKFSGSSWTAGLTLTYTPIVINGFFVDALLGTAWKNVVVNNPAAGTKGEADFFVPYIGTSVSKETEWSNFSVAFRVEANMPSVAGTEEQKLPDLGRFATSKDFVIGHWEASHSFYLEPLLDRMAWIEAKDWKKARLVHELAFATKGQYTFGDKRLAPQYEDVVGGSSTVRGYPESTAVGDTTVMGTFEYRFHLPRILKPSSVAEFAAPVESVAPTAPEASQGGDVKPRFATRPPAILAKPDWDLIFRTFLDAGWTHNNKRDLSTEVDRSLTGAGVGVEVQVSRYVNLRCDWGFALEAVDDKLMSKPVKAGDSRIHVQASIVW